MPPSCSWVFLDAKCCLIVQRLKAGCGREAGGADRAAPSVAGPVLGLSHSIPTGSGAMPCPDWGHASLAAPQGWPWAGVPWAPAPRRRWLFLAKQKFNVLRFSILSCEAGEAEPPLTPACLCGAAGLACPAQHWGCGCPRSSPYSCPLLPCALCFRVETSTLSQDRTTSPLEAPSRLGGISGTPAAWHRLCWGAWPESPSKGTGLCCGAARHRSSVQWPQCCYLGLWSCSSCRVCLCALCQKLLTDAGELAFAWSPANPARVRWHRLLVLSEGATTEKSPMAARDSGDRWGDLGEEQS